MNWFADREITIPNRPLPQTPSSDDDMSDSSDESLSDEIEDEDDDDDDDSGENSVNELKSESINGLSDIHHTSTSLPVETNNVNSKWVILTFCFIPKL